MGVEGRNRKVLQDIQNLVINPADLGANANVTKRLTRAQLEALAQAAAEKNKNIVPAARVEHAQQQCRLIIRMNIICQTQAACRVVPKDLVENIDSSYKDNELTATEYIDDIYKYYKLSEDDVRVHDYMVSQPDINAKMRSILIDWLIEVYRKFELMLETFYLTRYLLPILDGFGSDDLSKHYIYILSKKICRQ